MTLTLDDFSGSNILNDPTVGSQVIISGEANQTPFLALLLERGQNRVSPTAKFTTQTSALSARTTAINNASDDYGGTSSSIVVDDGSVFSVGDFIHFDAAGVTRRVTNVATNTLTISSGVGAAAATAGAVADDAAVRNIGAAAGEGSDTPDAVKPVLANVDNWRQTFREAVDLTRHAQGEAVKGEMTLEFLRRKALAEFQRDHEQALLFGAPQGTITDANGKRVYTTGGLNHFVTDNAVDIGGNLTRLNLGTAEQSMFKQGSPEKWAICGATALSSLTAVVEKNLHINKDATEANLTVLTVSLPEGGVLNLVRDPNMTGVYAGSIFVVDFMQIGLRYAPAVGTFPEGLPALRENVGERKTDGYKEEWFSDIGLDILNPFAHAHIFGITGSA